MTATGVTFRGVGECKPGQNAGMTPFAVFAHDVSGGTSAATVSVISALVMAVVLCVLVALVFARRAQQDERQTDPDS